MTQIRAFVGHSFTDDNEEVVGKFLRYFVQLSKSELSFSWEHAEAAEPKLLADKVMSLISDKNVFIGICTKNERVIPPASLTRGLIRRNVLKAQEREFSWKTSDWIIQEIGLAKGKNLDIILLMENGVRQPGGLQGDVEYISFDRSSPERSFGKILEMITALSPKASSPSVTSPDTRSMQAEEEREREAQVDDLWTTPQPDWNRRDYEIAVFRMTLAEDTAGIANIDQAYLATEAAAHDDDRNSWVAYCEYTRLAYGKGGSLAKLEALADAHPDSRGTLEYLARGFEKYQGYAKAASTYEVAARKATDDIEALRLMGCAAVEYVRADLRENSLAIINEMKTRVEKTGNGELQLLKVLRKLAELAKEDEATLAFMERIVEIDPSDINTRFSLAYKHSEIGNNELALAHYLNIPYRERSSSTWNNLGVKFDELSLSAKSVDAYRKAEGMGETLAMSNLARKLISAGFLFEAQQLCDEALTIENYDKNIGHDLARLKDLPGEEQEMEAELLDGVKPKSAFYRQFGRTASRSDPSELAERWEGPDCVLHAKLHGRSFSAVGSYELPSSALLGALVSGFGLTSSKDKMERFRVEYSGTLRGRAIEAHVTRAREDATQRSATVLGSNKDETKVLMVLTDDGSELKVMESPQGSSPRFYTLKRQATDV